MRTAWQRSCPSSTRHLVFTLPETLSELAHRNGPLIYHLLFTAACASAAVRGAHVDAARGGHGVHRRAAQLGTTLVCSRPPARLVARRRAVAWTAPRWRSLARGVALPTHLLREEFRTRLPGWPPDKPTTAANWCSPGGTDTCSHPRPSRSGWRTCAPVTGTSTPQRVDVGRTPEHDAEEAARRTLGYLAAYACGVALHNDRLDRDRGRPRGVLVQGLSRPRAGEDRAGARAGVHRPVPAPRPATPCPAHSELWLSRPESARERSCR